MPDIRFVREPIQAPVPLDSEQRAVASWRDGGLVVLGAPGAGKTATLIETVASILDDGADPDQVLVLAPGRTAASHLRAAIERRTRAVFDRAVARTPVSLAFEVLRSVPASVGGETPRLLSGGEQDRVLADLLAGHASGDVAGSGPDWPGSISAEVRSLRGFRTEFRELIGRCQEFGVGPQRLMELSEAVGEPVWKGCAQLFDEYQQVKAGVSQIATAYDSAELMVRAAVAMEAGGIPASLSSVRFVLLDDAQDMTEAVVALLRPLAREGAAIATFGNPDQATNGFRGGRTSLAVDLPQRLDLPSRTLVLRTEHRMAPRVAAIVARVADHIGVAGAVGHRGALHASHRTEQQPGDLMSPADQGEVRARVFTGSEQELVGVGELLRRRHLLDGVGWSSIAVVTRSSGQLPAVARALSSAGVPVSLSGVGGPVREVPVARALLLAIECAVTRSLDATVATELLRSFLGGYDGLSLRRLRRSLRALEIASGGDRRSDDVLVSELLAPDMLRTLPRSEARRANDLADSLARVGALAERGEPVNRLLWSLWDSSGQQQRWVDDAFGRGPAAAEANRNLDAVVALFASADRFVERFPKAAPIQYVRQQLDQAVPEDSLALVGIPDAVVLGTPASLVGKEFDTVVVMGLQEGVWPNTRLRNTLLGADRLVDAMVGQRSVDKAREVLEDECRLFLQAASRARHSLVLTGVGEQDQEPSRLLALVDGSIPEPAADEAQPSYTLRGLVGSLRRTLNGGGDERAAKVLAQLAAEGVPGADPAQWLGMRELSTDRPLVAKLDDGAVRVSPSHLDTFDQSPLAWFLRRAGAEPASSSAGVGTAIHAAFQATLDAGTDAVAAMRRALDERWPLLEFETDWEGRRQRGVAEHDVRLIADYLVRMRAQGRRAIAAEQPFETVIGTARVRGTIDRIEVDDTGRLHVIDLKTGASALALSEEELQENLQLLCYQLSMNDDGDDGERKGALGGAMLLIVRPDRKTPRERRQAAITPETAALARTRIDALARGMGGNRFEARLDPSGSPSGARDLVDLHLRGEITWAR